MQKSQNLTERKSRIYWKENVLIGSLLIESIEKIIVGLNRKEIRVCNENHFIRLLSEMTTSGARRTIVVRRCGEPSLGYRLREVRYLVVYDGRRTSSNLNQQNLAHNLDEIKNSFVRTFHHQVHLRTLESFDEPRVD